jgi:hypothetical protein
VRAAESACAALQRPASADRRQQSSSGSSCAASLGAGKQAGTCRCACARGSLGGERTETLGVRTDARCPARCATDWSSEQGERKRRSRRSMDQPQWAGPWLGQSVVTWSVSVRRGVMAKGRARRSRAPSQKHCSKAGGGTWAGWQ